MQIAGLNFLVVEDHEFQRGVALKILADLGATDVSWAEDGHSALRILDRPSAPVDIILVDLEMPGMDGMEFIRNLGEAGVPASIILVSGLDGTLIDAVGTMAVAYGVKILGVIEKPLLPASLLALSMLHVPVQPRKTSTPVVASFRMEEIEEGMGHGQFEPFFQPKVELATGRIKGVEALARWRHPRLGILAPLAFIPMLEDSGGIDALTWIMLGKAAAFCRRWRTASGLDVSVAANLSINSLADVAFADRVIELVRGEDVDPRHIILEVTESATVVDAGAVLENLSRLRMNGFGLSIDDYGTGYSSMQQLTRIAFSELKIDKSFVANAARQESARVILESSLDMARKLNITSVAEGVESRQDWDLLHQLGCELAQGYFIARPMEADRFLEWTTQLTGDGRWMRPA